MSAACPSVLRRQINPCGLEAQVMTRLEDLLENPPEMAEVKARLIAAFGRVFPGV